jgi:hypothetical protein
MADWPSSSKQKQHTDDCNDTIDEFGAEPGPGLGATPRLAMTDPYGPYPQDG